VLSEFNCKFALLEMITELSSVIVSEFVRRGGVNFRNQPCYGVPRSALIWVLLDCANDLLVVKTLAVRAGLGPAKLPRTPTPASVTSRPTPCSTPYTPIPATTPSSANSASRNSDSDCTFPITPPSHS